MKVFLNLSPLIKSQIFFMLLLSSSGLISGAKAATRNIALGKVVVDRGSAEVRQTFEEILHSELEGFANSDEAKATRKLNASLIRLDENYLLRLTLLDLEGDPLESRQTKILSLDELDIAVRRMLTAIFEGSPLRETAERGEILRTEQSSPTRLNSIGGFQFSLGSAAPLTPAFHTFVPLYTFALGYSWDLDHAIVEVRSDFGGGFNEAKTFLWTTTIGGQYVFWSNRTLTLYTGVSAGFGRFHADQTASYWNYHDGRKSGFVLTSDTGALFFRQADINLDVRLRTTVMTNTIAGYVPVTTGLSVGVRF